MHVPRCAHTHMSCMIVLTCASRPLARRRGSARASGGRNAKRAGARSDGDCGHRPDETQRASLPTPCSHADTWDTGDRSGSARKAHPRTTTHVQTNDGEDERHPRMTPCPARGHPEAVPPSGPGPPGTPKRPTSAHAVARGWGGSATLDVGP